VATILVKNLPEDTLKELKRLKVELGCKTWAELLAKLVESGRFPTLNEEGTNRMRLGVQGFLRLRDAVSKKWIGHPTVLEETGRSRKHEAR
jgi:hypothetical protein